MNRCKWVNLKNELYAKYHDEEWGVPSYDDGYTCAVSRRRDADHFVRILARQ